jgi:hypothetical protein
MNDLNTEAILEDKAGYQKILQNRAQAKKVRYAYV